MNAEGVIWTEPVGSEKWIIFSSSQCDHGISLLDPCRDCIWLESYPKYVGELVKENNALRS